MNSQQANFLLNAMLESTKVKSIIATLRYGGQAPSTAQGLLRDMADALDQAPNANEEFYRSVASRVRRGDWPAE